MRTVKPSWKSGVVLVCNNERTPDSPKPSCGEARGSALRQWLKDRLKAEGLKGEILAARTSCLGVCSSLGVTVEIVPTTPSGERRTVLVESEQDREALWALVKACLLGGDEPSFEQEG